MTEQERIYILEQLAIGGKAFLESIANLSAAQAVYKPTEESWSIQECAEHVALGERGMLWLLTHASQDPAHPPSQPEQDPRKLARAKDRTRKFAAPEKARPAGRFAALGEALDYFVESRRRTVQFVEHCSENLREISTVHPIAGRIDCYECLLLMAAHPARHAEQIKEIMGHPAFPK